MSLLLSDAKAHTDFAMALDDLLSMIRQAYYNKYGYEGTWVEKTYEDYIVVNKDSMLYGIPWKFEENAIVIGDTMTEMEQVYLPKATTFSEDEVIEREAQLFEAGEFKDKNVTITEQDLDTWINNFSEAKVPVEIEHIKTPFDGFLGSVKKLWRQGKILFGTVSFPKAVWTLAEAAGAKKLSVTVAPDLSCLTGVSFVTKPRIKSAQVFSGADLCFSEDAEAVITPFEYIPEDLEKAVGILTRSLMFSLPTKSKEEVNPLAGPVNPNPVVPPTVPTPAPVTPPVETPAAPQFSGPTPDQQRIAALEFALRMRDVNDQVRDLKAAGKIVPASEDAAKQCLLCQGSITFSENGQQVQMSASEAFMKFMSAQPQVVVMKELGGSPSNPVPSVTFSEDQTEFLAEFGVTSEDVAKYGMNPIYTPLPEVK
jgi:hypothetical protein